MKKTFKTMEIILLSLAHLMHDTFSAFLSPLLPLLIAKLNMSLSMIAFLDITRRLPALFNPFLGLLAERVGIKYFVILTPAITAASMTLLGVSNSAPIVFLLLFISGVSGTLFHLPSPVMIKEASGNQVGTGMSFFMVGGELARTLGPLIIITAVSFWSLEKIYRLMPIGIGASIILFYKLKNFELHRPVHRLRQSGDIKKLLIEHHLFLLAIGGFTLFQAGIKSALTLYLPVYLTGKGTSLWIAGVSLSILQFSGVIGAMVAGNISDSIGRRNTLVIASIGTVLFTALFILTQNVIFLGFLGFFLLSTGPVLMASVQDTETAMPTFMNSIYMTVNFGVGSLAVFAVGLMGDIIGLDKTYIVFCVFALGMIPMAFLIQKTRYHR
ncbi:MAG TPA: MFS transporter [Spirochaeta sp.]|nr:MFS transporter [Spirochaeta sp.]